MIPPLTFLLFLAAAFALFLLAMSAAASRQCRAVHEPSLNRTMYPSAFERVREDLLFHKNLSAFILIRDSQPRRCHYDFCYDWTSNGCSAVPSETFRTCCYRHDFGYRNYRKAQHCTGDDKKKVDKQFCRDMVGVCEMKVGSVSRVWCQAKAFVYYAGVGVGGKDSFCTK